ncbi:hypothetical protein J7J90_02095 [Candidatus Micrarchaeota archaeon]|nr:hypothetical protein [Candidatus Micrarchaeota archaeon]
MITSEELIKLCEMIHMKNNRDTENTSVTIFKVVLSFSNRPISSSTISYITGVHRLTVRHHLEKMKTIGFLREEKGKYVVRFKTLRDYIEYKKKMMLKRFKELERIADKIDKSITNEGEGYEW